MVIKIISIHIPKTAGRSFYQVLKWAYGSSVEVPMNMDKYVYFGKLDENYISESSEVIHGHFQFRHIEHLFKKYNPKLVFWLRDPVERILSNYYYNIRMNREKTWKLHADKRMNMELMDFVSREKRRNVMQRFLKGLKASDVFFFGFTETFEQDLQLLGKKLGWPLPVPNFRVNVGNGIPDIEDKAKKYRDIDPAIIEKIREFNAADITLYNEFKKLRQDQYESV